MKEKVKNGNNELMMLKNENKKLINEINEKMQELNTSSPNKLLEKTISEQTLDDINKKSKIQAYQDSIELCHTLLANKRITLQQSLNQINKVSGEEFLIKYTNN